MAKKKNSVAGESLIAQNRKARHDYEILRTFDAGIQLTGSEIKSLRMSKASIAESYISVDDNLEIWAENINIPEYKFATWTNHAPKRKRKLLLHKDEIVRLKTGVAEKGLTIVPLKLYFKHGLAKVEIALVRGKHLYDKRKSVKEREDLREAERAVKFKQYL
jgi:SsrA-binding protein